MTNLEKLQQLGIMAVSVGGLLFFVGAYAVTSAAGALRRRLARELEKMRDAP